MFYAGKRGPPSKPFTIMKMNNNKLQWNDRAKGIQIDLLNSSQNGVDVHIGG